MSTSTRSYSSRAAGNTAALAPSKGRGRPVDTAKREAILAAAAQAFFDIGYAASSIEQIAAEAGVSKVTVYNHFGDKRALFAAAVDHECDKMRGHFAIEAFPADASVRTRLTAIAQGMMAFLSRPQMVQFERRIAAETEDEPQLGLAFLEAGPRRMKKAFGAFLAAESARGALAIEDPELAAEQFVSMCKGMGDLERRFGVASSQEDSDARIAGAVDVFLRSYGTDR